MFHVKHVKAATMSHIVSRETLYGSGISLLHRRGHPTGANYSAAYNEEHSTDILQMIYLPLEDDVSRETYGGIFI